MERLRNFVIVTMAAGLLCAGLRAIAAELPETARATSEAPRDEDWAPQRFKGFEWISDIQTAQHGGDTRLGPVAVKQSSADPPPSNSGDKSAVGNSSNSNN